MVVSIIWSETQDGAAWSEPIDSGEIPTGESGSSLDEVWIRHTGTNKITNCAFYIQAYTGSYTGGASASDDYNELITWGNDSATDGFLIDQETFDGTETFVTHKTGQGTSVAPITLDGKSESPSGGGTNGEIAASADHKIQFKITVPSAEDTAGTRQFDQVLKYTYTS